MNNLTPINEQIEAVNASLYDPVTGLLSMRGFLDVARGMKPEYRDSNEFLKYAVVYFNLANFKLYNTKYGIDAGDERLRDIAYIIKTTFPTELSARFADDHFVVFAPQEGLEERIDLVYLKVLQLGGETILHIKAGVKLLLEKDRDIPVAEACDQAKMACDNIKHEAEQYICVYDESLNEDLRMKAYIIENIDLAIEKGYIQVYYQPVIRALTGKLCSMEALTRWIDPDYGFLSPGVFIPVLEEAHLIYKLDQYVVESVAKRLRYEEENGLQVVPISFNISRVDFLTGNPYEIVETAVQKYHINRNCLKCEITESTLMADPKAISEQIVRFREGGFEVWMDDFGSGYSSLNIMKEFDFDEIKIDMMFLRNLNEKGRRIIQSIVTMAKNLGIHTLAEGAETEEQVEFLKSIGCEKIQGYYYGKPQPFDAMRQHCRDFGIQAEGEIEAHVLEQAGLEDLNTTTPVALFIDNGKDFAILQMNAAYKETLATIGTFSAEEMMEILKSPYYSMGPKIRAFADHAARTGQDETMAFVENGQYMRLRCKTVGSFENLRVHRIILANITYNEDEKLVAEIDSLVRNTSQIFKDIYLWNVEEDKQMVVETTNPWEKARDEIPHLKQYLQEMAQTHLYPEDYDRYMEFIQPEHIYREIERSTQGFVSESFRILQPDGNYSWTEILAKVNVRSESKDILMFVKRSDLNDPDYREWVAKRIADTDIVRHTADGAAWSPDGELWRNQMKNTDVCYFWKDRERRFVGASQAFLDTYNITDIRQILGKTDEDMGWHIDDDPYKQDEIDVLERGRQIKDAIGICVIDGVPRQIAASKVPIYKGGEIIGLLGYFVVTDQANEKILEWETLHYTDPVTGCLNYRGAMDTVLRFEETYLQKKRNFIGIMVKVPEYERVLQNYGENTGNELLKLVAGKIREHADMDAVICRLKGGEFILFERMQDVNNAREQMLFLLNEIREVHKIGEVRTTISLQYTFIWRSEVQSVEQMQQVLWERMRVADQEDYTKALYSGERLIMDREKFDEMDERVYISDLETYELIYINKTALRDLGLPDDYDFRGKKCYELIVQGDSPCAFCSNAQLRRNRFVTTDYHNPLVSKDYHMRDTLVPWQGKNYRFSMSFCLSDYMDSIKENQEFMYKEMAINDAISVAMREDNVDEGIRKLLEKIGEANHADRAYIFEYEDNRMCSNTYEWCNEGVMPQKEHLQHLPKEVLAAFYDMFDQNESLVIDDLSDLKEAYPETYAVSEFQGIRNLIAVEIRDGDHKIGFLGLDNPDQTNVKALEAMLMTLGRFTGFMLRDRDAYRQLDLLSSRDALTGVMNRRALVNVAQRANEKSKLAFIFGDLNGLKMANDTLGHDTGDRLIKATANVMSSMVGSENVYRMGGDEFLMVTEMEDQDQADMMLCELRTQFDQEDLSVALGCVWKSGTIEDINAILKEADRRMYMNKEFMHRQMEG